MFPSVTDASASLKVLLYIFSFFFVDLESFDIDDPAINDDDDDDSNVIELPGNADDELDIEYLMTKLDLADVMENIQGN